MRFNRYFYAACISGVILISLVLVTGAVHFTVNFPEDEYYVELNPDAIKKQIEKKAKLAEVKSKPTPPKQITHKAYNSKIESDFSEADNIQTLEELIAERKMLKEAQAESDEENKFTPQGNGLASIKAAKERRKKTEEALKNAMAQTGGEQNRSNTKAATITYSLVDRIVVGDMPNPIYTCASGGKIVINVKVNANGTVVSASQNIASSTTTNGCLVDNAIHYAKQTKFNANPQTKLQVGTITYFFQDK